MPETKMQCRHVFTDGHRCGAICLRHQDLCYFHHTARRPIENPAARRRRGTTFTLPELEDRASIQLALSEILQRIAANDLDPKRAGHLLYGLQIATSLLPKLDPKHQPKSVSEITHDEELGDLAPVAEVGHDREPEPWELEIAKIMESIKPQAPEPTEDAIEEESQDTLPTIQAVANSNLTSHPSQLQAKSTDAASSSPTSVLGSVGWHLSTVPLPSAGAAPSATLSSPCEFSPLSCSYPVPARLCSRKPLPLPRASRRRTRSLRSTSRTA